MKVTSLVSLLLLSVSSTTATKQHVRSSSSSSVNIRKLEDASGEASYVDRLPIGKMQNLLITVDMIFTSGNAGGITFFTLESDIAGSSSSVTCDATLNSGSGDYNLILALRRDLYPADSWDCLSGDDDTTLPIEESCTISDGFSSAGQTVRGRLELAWTGTGTGTLGNALFVDVLCTANTPAPTPSPTSPPTSPPTLPPTSAPAPARDSSAGVCFSGESVVNVLGKGPTPMKELQVGEKVQAGLSGSYETVYGFAHLDKDSTADFLQIYLDDAANTMPLEITKDHMVYLDGQMIPASSVKKGDALHGINGPMKVTKVQLVQRTGLYAPLTPSGTIHVNGIMASNYILLQKGSSEFVELQGGIATLLPQHSAIHMFLSPLRVACMGVHSSLCSNDWMENGFHSFVHVGMKFVEWANQQNILLQLVLFGMFLLVLGPLYALECILGATSVAPLAMLAVGGSIYVAARQSNKEHMKLKVA